MKIRIFGTFLLSALLAGSAFAQQIENDDMYFNSTDRQKLRELKAKQYAVASARNTERTAEESEELNPTDSYSARTVNPEFSSRSNAETATADNEDYYINNYRYQTANNLRTFNNNFNDWYGSTWYSRNYWGPSINRWNSPFYGNYYSSWGNPWNNPYYAGVYSSSFSYYWGNNWNYGWGYNDYWNSPVNNYWGSGWGPSFAFGYSSWFGPSWYGGYPRVVVVNNSYGETSGQKVVYGKRPSRSSEFISTNANTRTRSMYVPDQGTGRTNSGGRSANTEYYNKSWRYTSPANTGYSSGSNTTTRTRSSSYSNDNGSRSSWGNSNNSYNSNSNSNSSYNSRSSSSSYGSGSSGSRSSTPSSSGGSNGRSRGSR